MSAETSAHPAVSFIVPAYNAESTLERSVQSILRQTGAAFEVIIVDDGSTDATSAVARDLADSDTRVSWFSQPNGGAASALNAGRRSARADLVASVDADDELAEEYLATMTAFIAAHPDYDFYSHDLWRMGQDGSIERVLGSHEITNLDLDEFLRHPTVIGPGTMWRKEMLEQLNGYSEGEYNEDYDLWLRALASGAKHISCPQLLYLYYQHESQKTADRLRVHQSIVRILERFSNEFDLTPDQLAEVQRQLAANRKMVRDYERYGWSESAIVAEAFEAGAAWLRRLVESVVPGPAVESTLRRIHRITLIFRPIRLRVWKCRVWIRRRLHTRA